MGNAESGPDDARRSLRPGGRFGMLWNQQWFIGPRVFTFDGPRREPKHRLPGDFEPHQAILLGGGWLAEEAPDVLGAIARLTKPRRLLVLLVSSAREREKVARVLAGHGVPPESVRILSVPTDTGWVRDFGPIFARKASGAIGAIDARYDRTTRRRDDDASQSIAERFGIEATPTPLRWQGGNLLSNGLGLIVTTTQSINDNIERGHDVETVTDFLKRQFGASQVVVLEHLVGEATGHVDMFACFTDPQTIVLGKYDVSVDPQNAPVLDRNAARLAEVRTPGGKLKVVRIPMPTNEDGAWRSFANVVFANDTLLVPIYPETAPAAGKQALAVYRRLLPDWTVLGVNAESLARHQGGLRCVTLYVPGGESCRPGACPSCGVRAERAGDRE